ncbi:hypothetical protein PK98_09745 [Croceibacterium mercuriale]|uniref:Uncharacterized protein n=1 Tax=Croceibacterium mercuriale TaxID=1572751 RepID=A0A0B2BRZ9_9SPHN|nr:hypothetical protein [Croceibacterium mercuriale]KHL24358.1 hypothetical protein PK98_09745 [Croceibacterium mercuriale]
MEASAAQMPWDKIIGAAASSALGVISLVILIAGGVAVLLFRNAGERTRLLVFGMLVFGLAGVVAAVLLQRETTVVPVPDDTAGPQQSGPVTPVPRPDDADVPDAQRTDDPPAEPDPPEPARLVATVPQIDGLWRDPDGFTYRIMQDGTDVAIEGYAAGQLIAQGEGTIAGQQLQYSFRNQANGSSGDCSGRIAPGERSISGSCDSTMGTMFFAVAR